MSNRVEKAASELKKIISDIIQKELKDPRIGFVTVTGLDLTTDLQQATVFFSVLGDKQQRQDTLEGLTHSAGFIRKLVGANIKMRYTPQIIFRLDESWDSGERIDKIIDQIHKKTDEPR